MRLTQDASTARVRRTLTTITALRPVPPTQIPKTVHWANHRLTMPPKFMSSKISKTWEEKKAPPPPKRRRRDDDDDVKIDYAATKEQMHRMVATRKEKSERSHLADLLSETKQEKKSMNYREMQDKIKRLKGLELEQRERDKELAGGGPAFVERKSLKKKRVTTRGLGQGVSEGYFVNGQLKVSKKTIDRVKGEKQRTKL